MFTTSVNVYKKTWESHVIFYLYFAGYVGSLGDKPRVEIKGRFSVTSENVDLAKVGATHTLE